MTLVKDVISQKVILVPNDGRYVETDSDYNIFVYNRSSDYYFDVGVVLDEDTCEIIGDNYDILKNKNGKDFLIIDRSKRCEHVGNRCVVKQYRL